MEFRGANVVVIGGTGEIGGAVCKTFLKEKISNLAILDKNENPEFIKGLAAEYPDTKILFLNLDISVKSEIDECFKAIVNEFKFIDVLINSAGIVNEGNPELTIAVNLCGVILTTLKAIEYMSIDKGGRGGLIANVASAGGLEVLPTQSIYSASKHGVVGFTRNISSDIYFQHTGITINTICPGKTDTSMTANLKVRTTLEYGQKYNARILLVKGQTADQCAECMMRAFKIFKNGAVWLVDKNELTEVHFPTYWSPESLEPQNGVKADSN